MIRVNGFYLYQLGYQVHPLSTLRARSGLDRGTEIDHALALLVVAEGALDDLLNNRTVLRLRTASPTGQKLLAAVKQVRIRIEAANEQSSHLDVLEVLSVRSALTDFEAVFGAELAGLPLYGVTRKAGYDLATLIGNGVACFPAELPSKAPEALPDLQQATRCIAFELFTAAGFHLHRANEAVLRRYWDAVTNGAPRPASGNMGNYLNELNNRNEGDARVKAALKDLKNLHRNPLIHPGQTLDNVDEALALMNGVHAALLNMLKEMPVIAAVPQPTPTGSIPTSSQN